MGDSPGEALFSVVSERSTLESGGVMPRIGFLYFGVWSRRSRRHFRKEGDVRHVEAARERSVCG